MKPSLINVMSQEVPCRRTQDTSLTSIKLVILPLTFVYLLLLLGASWTELAALSLAALKC